MTTKTRQQPLCLGATPLGAPSLWPPAFRKTRTRAPWAILGVVRVVMRVNMALVSSPKLKVVFGAYGGCCVVTGWRSHPLG